MNGGDMGWAQWGQAWGIWVALGLLGGWWACRRVLRGGFGPSREGTGLAPHLTGSAIPERPRLPVPPRMPLERRALPGLQADLLTLTPHAGTPHAGRAQHARGQPPSSAASPPAPTPQDLGPHQKPQGSERLTGT